jgi:hypothetical protein
VQQLEDRDDREARGLQARETLPRAAAHIPKEECEDGAQQEYCGVENRMQRRKHRARRQQHRSHSPQQKDEYRKHVAAGIESPLDVHLRQGYSLFHVL